MTTGEKIRKRRCELGLKQTDVAKKMGITGSLVSQYERDVVHPKIETIQRFATALNTTVDDISNIDTESEPELITDDFGAICNCAVRYCLGRRSYMPKLVVDYIAPLLPKLTEKTLACFQMDIEDRKKTGFDFGADCDVETWDGFYKAVCDEVERRRKHEID